MKLAIILPIAGAAIGFAASFLIAPRYASTAELMLTATGPQPVSLAGQYLRLEGGVNQIVDSLNPHDSVVAAIRNHALQITPISRPSIDGKDVLVFRIHFDYPDARTAQALVKEITDRLREVNIRLQRADARGPVAELEARVAALEAKLSVRPETQPHSQRVVPAFTIVVLEPPSYPVYPASPNRAILTAVGFGSGVILAVTIYFFRRRTPFAPVATLA